MDRRASITKIDLEYMLCDEDAYPRALPFSLLEQITNGFSDEHIIGRGGFSVVYMGKLSNGAVAVKRLTHAYRHEAAFQREVECLVKTRHKSIIRFLGYCSDTQGSMGTYDGKFVMAETQQRLLCFEYLPNGSLSDYIQDSSAGLEWRERYKIIKGICEGLTYLHHNNILHLDLKPGNVLMDEDMLPKIADFGHSRSLEKYQTSINTTTFSGTLGYMAPEFAGHKITRTFDLYSLGVIIIEILTGKRGYHNVENILQSWSNRSNILQRGQIQVCSEIAIECMDFNPSKRPVSTQQIIDRLFAAESSTQVIPAGGTSKTLLLDKFVLYFPFEPNKVITFPLQLTNNTNKHVAFRLTNKHMESSFLRLPLYGLVPPNTPYTIIMTTHEKEELPPKYIIDVILHSATLTLGDDGHVYTSQIHIDKFFQEMANGVQEVKLKALYTLPRHITTLSFKPISPSTQIICKVKGPALYSLDTNQAKQWIIIGEDNGHVGFWDYQTQRKVDSIKVSSNRVTCLKFIERKQWIVAGTNNGNVHVYDYRQMRKITSFRVGTFEDLVSLAVHPTRPYLLSAGTSMKLWDWDKGWECIQTFQDKNHDTTYQVAFNQIGTFVGSSMDYTVKVWSLDSCECNHALLGHSNKINCLAFFTCHDEEFLVTGSDDQTAKIWYLQKNICAYTLEAFVSPVTSVLYQPSHQTLIMGSKDGAIYLWGTKNCRIYSSPPMLKRIIMIGCTGATYHLACAMGRVVIGKENTVAIMDIDNVNYKEQSTYYSEQQPSPDTRHYARDTTSRQEILWPINKLLDVQPLDLHFPYDSNEPIPCSLHLTNNTDENVAFRLVDKSGKSAWCFVKMPLYGVVPRKSTYILIVTTKEEMKLKEETDFDLVIQSILLGNKYITVFDNQTESDEVFEEAKGFGNMLHEVALKAVYLQFGEITSECFIQSQNILVKYNPDTLCSLDAHPVEPWILTGHGSGYARLWNHHIKYPLSSFKISEYAGCAKFIARREWLVAITDRGHLYVYDCACVMNIKEITAVRPTGVTITPLLAIHPILPYVLSFPTMVLDWDQGWKVTQIIDGTSMVTAAFNPEDANSFVSGSSDGEVKIWKLDSTDPEYCLHGHLDAVNCLDFLTLWDRQYLITGSNDCSAKIWDMQKRACICTLEAMSPVRCVLVHPTLPVVITGTEHGIIHVWSSTDFRLKRTINLGGGGPVVGLACLMGSRRVVIGQGNAIRTIEIRNDDGIDCPPSDVDTGPTIVGKK
ncbi:uncharacterized protein LOC119337485 isoform X3 [Triticum dicoccoides]|uniref:uncharacterized protein LOC119337485 isoform X3 n=1 Tax=Triticum dicoccoides TaxID=85692 RepID=UPI001890B6B9|nr:uncharacterized protein LOC119337485 isoform X3 [Triticum dicoccoides]